MKDTFHLVITGHLQSECLEIEALCTSPHFETTVTPLNELSWSSEQTDLFIVCLSHQIDSKVELGAGKEPMFAQRSLFISASHRDSVRLWAFQRGADDFLVKPFSRAELQMRIDRLLRSGDRVLQGMLSEESCLTFLREMNNAKLTCLEPALDFSQANGYFYPDVARVFGNTSNDAEFLEELAEKNLFTRQLRKRVRLCPFCDHVHLNYHEACSKCGSVDIQQNDIVHHFSCGHINTLDKFQQGSVLVCPKCSKELRHIGLDYERPTNYFRCNDCDYLSSEPDVKVQCLWCSTVCEPRETLERNVYAYESTRLVDEALANGQIAGINLAALLHNQHTGLHSRQFFEIELHREFVRTQRYGYVFTLMFIRIENLAQLRRQQENRISTYVNSVFEALRRNMRFLDTLCVWDTDTVGVILADTTQEDAETVVQRMQNNVESLEYLYTIQKPKITTSLIVSGPNYTHHEEMLAQLQELLDAKTKN